MSRHLDPFYSAKLPFGRIHADIADIKIRAAALIDQRNLVPIPQKDADTGELIYKVRIVQDVPDDIERDAIRHLTEIRSALDKAINGCAKILGSRSLKHTNFPFGYAAGGLRAFKSQLSNTRGPWRGIPDELHAYLLELMPFPTRDGTSDGNDLLALLGELSNPAKHENTLFISIQVNGIGITNMSGGSFHFPRIQTIWNDAHDECEVFRLLPTDGQMEFVIPTQISFNSSGIYSDRDFAGLLSDMAHMAERIVLGVEAKTTEVRKVRN
ncbi:hypothetical protein [Prosthecodimorpha staleyi]|uniref:Uncharacterized protein n=1 Tax=Prosthecodimorpha staleyi TaxID=2840188 RepID=A0A947D0S0_9HYPH|nr:hypothetical protein [Prosthecodimorpha staleyi]MBT9288823.1 hypothetical protein [Prosthecodimorpha staleyi]